MAAPSTDPSVADPFRCVVQHSGDAFVLLAPDGRVLDANPAAAERFGVRREALLELSLADLVPDRDVERAVLGASGRDCADAPLVLDAVHRCADGSTTHAELRVGAWPGEHDLRFLLLRDPDGRERDVLTGLLTCSALTRHARSAVAAAKASGGSVAVLHVDLNRFSLVNHAVGRDAADEMLRQVAWRLRDAAGPHAVLARHSADEFLVLLPDDAAAAGSAAERVAGEVHRALAAPFTAGGSEVFLDAAIGTSLFPEDADSAEVLLRNADVAAQQAKRPGQGPTCQFAGETSDRWARLWLAGRLRRALRDDALVVHYQPLVRLDADPALPLRERMVGVEALVRLRTDDGRLVPPGRFIALAEDLGLIEQLGDRVFAALCRDGARWRAGGWRFKLACNLSLQELWRPAVAARFVAQAAAHGIDPGDVVIEITESSAMTDPVRTARVLRELADHGFGLAIDDFGAGHSSLARLSEVPADVLKLDRQFIAHVPEDRAAAALVAAMLELARNLGMEPLAEGIETEEQRRFVVEHGCRFGQGFLFSPPVAADALTDL